MDEPVPTGVPPQLPEYHFQEAPVPNDPPETDKVVELPEQTEIVPVIYVGETETVLIVMETVFEVAGLPVAQVALEVSTQVT